MKTLYIVLPAVFITLLVIVVSLWWWFGLTILHFGTPSTEEMIAGTYDVKINGHDDNQRFYSPTFYDLTWTISPKTDCALFGYFGEEKGFLSKKVNSSGSERIEKLNDSGVYLYSIECTSGDFSTGDSVQVYVN